MSLEVIADKEGIRLAQRTMPLGKKLSFVRGWREQSNGSVRMILEERLFGRRRYAVTIKLDDITSPYMLNNVLLVHYNGHYLFPSMEDEDKFYTYLNHSLREGSIEPEKYELILNELNNRIKILHAQLYDGGMLTREQRMNLAFLSAGIAGVIGIIMAKGKNKFLNSLTSAAGSFLGANLAYRYIEKSGVIESLKIKPDDPVVGEYFSKSLGNDFS